MTRASAWRKSSAARTFRMAVLTIPRCWYTWTSGSAADVV
jgi:hypothetical protein